MSFGESGAAAGIPDKEVQEFVMMEEQKAQFMMQKLKSSLEVVVGTYEELSLGYRLNDEGKFEQTFTDHSHAGCVRAATVSPNGLLATGSSDEMIRLFHLRKGKELGSLGHHEGSITWLEFFSNTHMFSCSGDGSIGLWNANNWECLKTFRGHKGAVHCCSFHPSGKLAISVGQDKTLRLWNLITGRSAYTKNLGFPADFVKWSKDGLLYFIVRNHEILVYKTEGASLEREITCSSRIHALECTSKGTLLVGIEEGLVVAYDIGNGEKLVENKVHENRVKAMVLLEGNSEQSTATLVTASSDSKIKVWTLDIEGRTELVSEVDTKFRITSMGAWLRRKTGNTRKTPKEAEAVEEAVRKEPKTKKAKVEIEYENNEPEVGDKLAQRLLKKTKRKKGKK